ncbi:uncharacterized protein LOC111244872 isoform X2 [Varroa destructor]|uniref:Uncharacterized protein n=1 Tax=Varroa destructor TaxID=109461 RepID=A0A7M7J854_VARDE|nr:uncharacterized protein LOC111244872 isoform X2 [Varroa destructor]
MFHGSGGSSAGNSRSLVDDFLALQERCMTLEKINVEILDSLASGIQAISTIIVNSVKSTDDLIEQTDGIDMLRELIKCSLAAFGVVNGATVQTRMLAIKGFIRLLQTTSTLYNEIQQNGTSSCLEKLNQSIMEGILGLRKLIEGSFSGVDPDLFSDICDLLIKLCKSEARSGMKRHVGLIKIYNQMLLFVKHLPPLTNLAPHLEALSTAELTAVLNHYSTILEGNINNDCLIIAICIVFSYLPRKSFKDIEDTRLRSALRGVGERVLKSGLKIGKLFGLAGFFSFFRDVDDLRLVVQPTKQITDELVKLFQGNLRQDEWAEILSIIEEGYVNRIEPLQNEYFKYERKGIEIKNSDVKSAGPELQNTSSVRELCRVVYGIEKRSNLNQEDRVLIEICLDKLNGLLN